MICLVLSSALHSPLLYAVGRVQTSTAMVLGLSHAGGTYRLFLGWERLVPHDTQLSILCYPGREVRLTHIPFRRMSDLVGQILPAALFLEDIDLYLFDHSMGIPVGYAVCQEMRTRGRRAPSGLVVSSSRPPWGTPESAPICTRSDANLCGELPALGDTSLEVLRDPATGEFVLSSLWADYELPETWMPMEGPIDSSIHEIHGDAGTLTEDDIDGWRRSTTSDFHPRTILGEHFHLSDSPILATYCPTDFIRFRRTINHQQYEWRGAPYMDIRTDSVNKPFGQGDGKIDVLEDVSCTVDEPEICMIVGASGSGKSTLSNCLGGLDRPDSGTILVGDREITSLSRKDLGRYRRDLVGFVLQFYSLVPTLTARENVGVREYLSNGLTPLDDLLADLGLADHRNKFPSRLPGGQQQYYAIACALIKCPRLLLYDEPAGAFDYETSKEMLSLLERINHDLGTIIVIVTYNQVLAEMAHRIITVRNGRTSDVEVREGPAPASSLTW